MVIYAVLKYTNGHPLYSHNQDTINYTFLISPAHSDTSDSMAGTYTLIFGNMRLNDKLKQVGHKSVLSIWKKNGEQNTGCLVWPKRVFCV